MKVYPVHQEKYFKVNDVKEYLNPDDDNLVDLIYSSLFDIYGEKIVRWQINEVLSVLQKYIDEKLTMYVESD